ncbi:T9SS type B sorting domain-containing protein [Flavimarina sp. Hel_I_48]|uniref:T9SS type B sorting domain-containing protein n=1 Tax=Flavimarina sp. Hel_I_48 TaxID=1392488 RepID=UPI0004DF89CD|nr:T9SS type B sorting domain-containing protein [Flavimarina sp. Hel_I_48]
MQNYNVVNQQIGALKVAFTVLLFLCTTLGFSQTVSVDNSQSAPSLVNMLLNDACAEISNISSSSIEATGSFTNNGGAFPIADGVIIRTGNAGLTAGGYTGNNLDSQLNNDTDPFLQQLLDESGRAAVIEEIAFLEFDFVPVSNFLSFDFLLASNEYGDEQCNSSDVLAFILTDLENGTETNLGVIPGGTTPVSVQNIKDAAFNPTCPSVNADLFASYEVDNNESTINMNGYTSVLTASSSNVVPGRRYKMRIVIGDANDTRFDSAIFLSAGSFNTGINLGETFSLCGGDSTVLESGLAGEGYTFEWFRNGVLLPGEIETNLTIDQSGTYKVEVTRGNSSCLLEDEVVVSDLQVTEPVDVGACFSNSGSSLFDLTENNAETLGITGLGYEILYYASQEDLDNGIAIPTNEITSYASAGNQTIFIKLRNIENGSFCDAQYDFELSVADPIDVNPPAPIEICLLPGESGSIDLSTILPVFPNGEDPNGYAITYHNTLSDAENAVSPIDTTATYTIPPGIASRSVYIRVALVDEPTCYVVVTLLIEVGDLPPVDVREDVVTCGSYILPEITDGTYYLLPGGEGTALSPGDEINTQFTQTIYIYNESAEGCPNETSSFTVTLPDKFELDDTRGCAGEYVLPLLPEGAGAFYTAADGPNGGGSEYDSEQSITTSRTVYYYAEVDGSVCINQGYDLTIDPLPALSKPEDEIVCGSYTLPALANGEYNTQADGQGTTLQAGDVITTSQTIYTYSENARCNDASEFNIFIVPTLAYFEAANSDLPHCGSFDLPEIEVGAYYTEANGQGIEIPKNNPLTVSRPVYYYAEVTTGDNCTEDLSFDVVITPIPKVDNPVDVSICVNDAPYILPKTTNGQYFTESDRGGTQLPAGSEINATQTIYVNNEVDGCTNENEFSVTLRPKPPIDNFVPVYACDTYELPVLTNGVYYTEAGGPNGTGELLEAGTVFSENTTLWIYNAYDDLLGCFNDKSFDITILGVEVGEFEDVVSCDAYVLPELVNGNYYTAPRGRGTRLNAGDRIVETQQIYVYSRKGTRFICEDFDDFTVTISETPLIEPINDIEACGSFTLPALDQTVFDIAYYRAPNGQDPIASSDLTLDQPGTYTIYRYATAKNNTDCFDEDLFQVTIYPLLDFSVEGGTVCTDPETGEVLESLTLESGLDPAEFEVTWSINNEVVSVGPTHEATAVGTYTVSTTKINPEVGADCNYNPTTVEVLASSEPIIEAEVNQSFADVSIITVIVVSGDGDYEYQIDGGEFQASNEFYDVTSGKHEVTARGITGNCAATTIIVNVVNYQKFFTPNADGINDTWNIESLRGYADGQIEIFDRYGKLLKTIFPDGNGWDGTFRGENMPSDDYWFKVRFVDEEGMPVEFKAHFTLKR